MLGSGLNLVTTVIGFGMSATFIVFVCARLICDRAMEHSPSGLDPFVLAAIPTINYSCEAFHSKDDAQCSICLGEYREKEMLRIMPTCRHNFHLECIDVWLQKQTTCPICRISLKDLPVAKATASPLRSLPQLLGHSESPVNRSPHWILPNHRDRTGGRQNSPASQESLAVAIEIQPQRQ
ncbi:putative RING-H2 finger protein ATL62 [Phragmites australis]|uniref:putative RING-H2 finger protein ATL62 n=1 Tax=Phragmites australis TaxID=29695 RepID=UPI002D787537|nr:putative RING-H2 finger protein ATL62 [Phragmites australis]